MYNDVIKKLLKKIEVLPKKVIIMYLMKVCGLSENMANQALFAACRSRACFDKGDYVARMPYLEMDSAMMKKAKAFRVLIEFLPSSKEFICAQYPWTLAFTCQNSLVQIGYIERNMETVSSSLIAGIAVPESERANIKRIIIVEEGCNLSKMKRAGFSFFCTVDDSFELKILGKCKEDEMWDDVPEKA